MQILSKSQVSAVSGGLDASQATYAGVLSAQAMLGLVVQGACLATKASPQNVLIAYGLIPAMNVIAYVGISELGNWYFAKTQ